MYFSPNAGVYVSEENDAPMYIFIIYQFVQEQTPDMDLAYLQNITYFKSFRIYINC